MSDSNVVGIFDKQFSVGSYAWHKRYESCRVMAVNGCQRMVKTARIQPGGLVHKIYEVEVCELIPLAPHMIDVMRLLGVDLPMDDEENLLREQE